MAIIPTNTGLFVVLGQTNIAEIGVQIEALFGHDSYALSTGQWLISSPGSTTKGISDQLGISTEPFVGSAIVVSVGNYFGVADAQIWEWIAAKMGAVRV
jgi:hypothetical protein